MKQPTIFSATDARQNFFSLLRTVQNGRDVVIVKKDDNTRFKVTLAGRKLQKKDIMKIVERMGKIGLKTGPWEEMEKIITEAHAPCLP